MPSGEDKRADPPPASAEVGELYQGAAPQLRRLARANERADADDLVQSVFVRFLSQDRAGLVEHPLRYLFGIARNLRLDRARNRARSAAALQAHELAQIQPGDGADPERALAAKQQLGLAMSAIDELPPRCREAFLLRRFDGLSHAEIGRRMGISTSMVEKHVADAMRRITTRLETSDAPAPVGCAASGVLGAGTETRR